VEQKQKSRIQSFIRELVPDWRPTRKQALWAIRSVVVLVVVLGLLTLIGLPFGITLWAWAKLLIVPAVIAAGGLWFNRQQRDREMESIEQRSQDAALQAYLDQMSQLLTDKDRALHRAQLGDSLSTVARARTLTVLTGLEGERKGSIVGFLYEAGLITKDRLILDLHGADLSGADLSGADLSGTNLSGANLSRTNLSGANLSGVDAHDADLLGAKLWSAKLYGADLSFAELNDASLILADLRDTSLIGALLHGANLFAAKLAGALLGKDTLSQARWIDKTLLEELEEQLTFVEADTVGGVRMEVWQIPPDAHREDVENPGPS
jgi:uncharacterized protein YjbI with pentapeptide repeats